MGAQLLLKAAMPLAGILMTASDRCNKTGPCAIIQIKYVLPKLCHPPQYSYGSRDPTTRVLGLRLVPGWWDPGSVLILGQVTQYGNPYLICIISTYNTQGQVFASYMGLHKGIGRCAIVSVLFTDLTLVAIPN